MYTEHVKKFVYQASAVKETFDSNISSVTTVIGQKGILLLKHIHTHKKNLFVSILLYKPENWEKIY